MNARDQAIRHAHKLAEAWRRPYSVWHKGGEYQTAQDGPQTRRYKGWRRVYSTREPQQDDCNETCNGTDSDNDAAGD